MARTEAQWDEFLKTIRAGRTKNSINEHKNISFGSSHISLIKNSFSKNTKQSVVKMISNLPRESIKRCIDYTLNNSIDGSAINEKGERVSSDEIMKNWSKDFGTNKNSKDAWHLIFAINEPRGLKYENKNAMHKDLKKEFSKIKSSINLEQDSYTAKDKTLEFYEQMQEKNKIEYNATSSRIKAMNDEIDLLKKANDELTRQFLLYVQKKGKKRFRLGKELKENNKILLQKRKDLIKEIKKLDSLSYKATQINDMHLAHYKDQSDTLKLLENFSYNFNKIYPHGKGSSKADWLFSKKVKRSIAVLRGRDDNAKKYFDDSLVATRLLGRNESLFKLNKKLEILDQSLYILHHSELGDTEKNEFKKRLDDNKDFISDICKKRFSYIENKLLKSEKISKDDFLLKEYFKGVSMLDTTANERLVRIKNERRLYKDVLAEREAMGLNSYSSYDKTQNEKNNDRGR